LRGQRDEARAKGAQVALRLRDAMRVVDAADVMAGLWRDSGLLRADAVFTAAVDAWRAVQPDQEAPTDRPSATEGP